MKRDWMRRTSFVCSSRGVHLQEKWMWIISTFKNRNACRPLHVFTRVPCLHLQQSCLSTDGCLMCEFFLGWWGGYLEGRRENAEHQTEKWRKFGQVIFVLFNGFHFFFSFLNLPYSVWVISSIKFISCFNTTHSFRAESFGILDVLVRTFMYMYIQIELIYIKKYRYIFCLVCEIHWSNIY